MVILKHFSAYLFLLLLLSLESRSQTVSNVSAEQAGNSLIISYSLKSSAPCEIDLSFSTDGGKAWIKVIEGVYGDVGKNVVQGVHKIRWEVLESFDDFVDANVKFKVAARMLETIQVGKQTWMVSNLNVVRFRNGDIIQEAHTLEEWIRASDNKEPAWCNYNNDVESEKVYGKLYNWYAVNDSRGLAPLGWHVPSDSDWNSLSTYLGGKEIAGAKLKSSNGWGNGGNGSNSSLFSGDPGGYRSFNGLFAFQNEVGYWWSSTEVLDNTASLRRLDYDRNVLHSNDYFKGLGLSVRCIRD